MAASSIQNLTLTALSIQSSLLVLKVQFSKRGKQGHTQTENQSLAHTNRTSFPQQMYHFISWRPRPSFELLVLQRIHLICSNMKGNEARSAKLHSIQHPTCNERQLISLINLLKDVNSITRTSKMSPWCHSLYCSICVSVLHLRWVRMCLLHMFICVTEECVKELWPMMKLT